MSGSVTGGWEFVIAAYGISFTVLGFYFFSTWSRYRAARRNAETRERDLP